MTITDDILNDIRSFGERNLPPHLMAVRLSLSYADEMRLAAAFEDRDSLVRRAWENGRMDKIDQIEDNLMDSVREGGEGSGEAATAVNRLQRRRMNDDLKRELFGV
nr:hypothetical protein [uncultured Carboxylicivirga sp.]